MITSSTTGIYSFNWYFNGKHRFYSNKTVSTNHLLSILYLFVGLGLVWFMVFNATFNNILALVEVSFIGGGNQSAPLKHVASH